MTNKNTEIERPLELLLKIGNLEKTELDAIIKNIKHLDSKAYINGDTLKLAFPVKTALQITTESFVNILYASTSRIVYGSVEGSSLCFKFSNNKVTLEEFMAAPEEEPTEDSQVDEKNLKRKTVE